MRIKLVIAYFLVSWSTPEAVLQECVGSGYAALCKPCTIQNVLHEERFENILEAQGRVAALKTNGIDAKLYEVKEIV